METANSDFIRTEFNRFLQTESERRASEPVYEESEEEMQKFVTLFRNIGTVYTGQTDGRTFEIDSDNEQAVRVLIAYQLGWEKSFRESYTKAKGLNRSNLFNPLMLIGDRGVGKTLLLKIASRFASITGRVSRFFIQTSASELLNHYRVHGNIDRYTYNIETAGVHGKPLNLCFNDLGVEKDEKSNIYGTSVTSVVRDFLLARYEIDQNLGALCHITTNLSPQEIGKLYPERVADRLRQYNIIPIVGETRRRN